MITRLGQKVSMLRSANLPELEVSTRMLQLPDKKRHIWSNFSHLSWNWYSSSEMKRIFLVPGGRSDVATGILFLTRNQTTSAASNRPAPVGPWCWTLSANHSFTSLEEMQHASAISSTDRRRCPFFLLWYHPLIMLIFPAEVLCDNAPWISTGRLATGVPRR